MSHDYDPGYGNEPFKTLCREHPDETVYPRADFRVEWGPIFHRGRLDGSARVLVIGQDPAAHETIIRRILVGAAGQRVQGFLAKLGVRRSYVMVNVFLYSVFGQQGGERHKNDAGIIAYRNRWLDALLIGQKIEAVVAFGELAGGAWKKWKATPKGQDFEVAAVKIPHPTYPESAFSNNEEKRKAATKAMLSKWNGALNTLKTAITHPDEPTGLVPYGDDFQPNDLQGIPEFDVPPGVPPWMRGQESWATRTGSTTKEKRATITVTVPATFLP
jgi:uracil-DNA glycosylase